MIVHRYLALHGNLLIGTVPNSLWELAFSFPTEYVGCPVLCLPALWCSDICILCIHYRAALQTPWYGRPSETVHPPQRTDGHDSDARIHADLHVRRLG